MTTSLNGADSRIHKRGAVLARPRHHSPARRRSRTLRARGGSESRGAPTGAGEIRTAALGAWAPSRDADESGWCTVTWDQGGSNAYRVGSFSMFDLCRWTSGPSGTPPPTVGRTTTAHARDDDQEGRQHDTRTRTRDRRTAVAEQTTLEKEAWNMPGTWKRTPPPHVRFADTEQMFHSTEEMHQV